MGTPRLSDLVVERDPPLNRRGKSIGDKEQHLTEAAVMLAFAMHLFETHPDLRHVQVHPDGEHGKGFDIRRWLAAQGFQLDQSVASTSYGGLYRCGDSSILVQIRPGLGDVVAEANGQKIVAECKGGVINTRHARGSYRGSDEGSAKL